MAATASGHKVEATRTHRTISHFPERKKEQQNQSQDLAAASSDEVFRAVSGEFAHGCIADASRFYG